MDGRIRELYDRERRSLLGFIKKRLKDHSLAEDILQDVFYQAVLNRSVFESLENGAAWLFTAARNRIIDWYRKRENSNLPLAVRDESGAWEDLVVESDLRVEDEYERKIVEDAITAAVDELPKEQKEVFIKNELYRITFREMSEETGISINTLIARKRYAVNSLRRCLKEIKEIMNGE